ncbi:hypothetical protein [Massilia sp. H6]|uniref:hypothetical protein n=1 Tax=Massilia sp. H6 TaxID=2970464 RepID=UPI0021676725|nr:hypothetical protein [Massilia sp. H6]UVW27529.1 hypothetical protein NRS07_13345 [Massilia sp. H6]
MDEVARIKRSYLEFKKSEIKKIDSILTVHGLWNLKKFGDRSSGVFRSSSMIGDEVEAWRRPSMLGLSRLSGEKSPAPEIKKETT